MAVFQIDNLLTTKPNIAKLPVLERKIVLNFAVALYKNRRVYLTGAENWVDPLKAYYYDIRVQSWNNLPALNTYRTMHSSICRGENLYVLGG